MSSRENHLATVEELTQLFQEELKGEEGLRPLKGFKLNFSANSNFHRVYFAASCECGTSALLSVEVDKNKTLEEVKEAMPSLMNHLRSKERAFRKMPCHVHSSMRSGGGT